MQTALTTTAGLGGVVALSMGHPAPGARAAFARYGVW